MRNLVDGALHYDIKNYYENKYTKVFSLLKFNEKSFMRIFNEPNITFLLLNYKIKKSGMYNVPKYLYRDEHSQFIQIDGLSVSYNIEAVVYWVLLLNPKNKFKRAYTGKEIYNIAVSKFKYNPAELVDEARFNDALRHEKNAIEIVEKECLFYDNSELIKKLKKFNKSIDRKNGIYSIEIIFEENQVFYQSLGINSGLSLHDISSKYRNQLESKKNIKVLGYQSILFGYPSKKDFFKSVPKRFRNFSVEEVINKLYDVGGVDKDYLRISIKSINKSMINKNGIIKASSSDFTDRQIKLLKRKLVNDYYQIGDFLRFIRTVKPSVPKRILETEELNKLGYRKEYNYIIKQSIRDIRKHIEFNILLDDFLKLRVYEDLDSIELDVINSMIKKFKLVRISDNELITNKKLKSIGVYKKNILEFIK